MEWLFTIEGSQVNKIDAQYCDFDYEHGAIVAYNKNKAYVSFETFDITVNELYCDPDDDYVPSHWMAW